MSLEKRLKYIEDSIECVNGRALVAWSKNRPSFHTRFTSLDMVALVVMYRMAGQYRIRRLPATADRDQYGEQRIYVESKDMVRVLDGTRRNMVLHRARVKPEESVEDASTDRLLKEGAPEGFTDGREDLLLLDMAEEMLAREHYEAPLGTPPIYILTRDVTQLTARKGGPVDLTHALPLPECRASFAVPFAEACGKGIIVADMEKADRVCMFMPLADILSNDPMIVIDTGIKMEVAGHEDPKGRAGPLRAEAPRGYQCSYRRPGTGP